MRSFPFAAVVAALLVLPLAPTHAAEAPAVVDPVLVAVIDSGINASHPEFAAGQVKAWKDFSSRASPTPYDLNGHGTGTASLVGGLNLGACGAVPKRSYAPGVGLLIANVFEPPSGAVGDDGTVLDIDPAIRWAVAQGADVISVSIGAIVPVPLRADQAIRDARNAGVTVIFAAGNGFAGAGVAPFPTWASFYGNSLHVLTVGGGSQSGATLGSTTGNTDPDVTAWSDNVCVARATGGYGLTGGTSFAAPLVSGMAAKAIETARANGQPATPARIESILMYAASNNAFSPYAREGLGNLGDDDQGRILQWAADGTGIGAMQLAYDGQGTTTYDPAGSPASGHAKADRTYREVVVRNLRGAQLV